MSVFNICYHRIASCVLASNRAKLRRRDTKRRIVGMECLELRELLSATHPLSLGSLDGTNGFRIDGIVAGDMAGYPVSDAGDVNRDGFDDVIIGAYLAGSTSLPGAGESYVVFGKAGGFSAAVDLSALDGTNGFQLNGGVTLDGAGRSVSAAGDVNGDGFDDLLVGANLASPVETYVIFGKPTWSHTLDLGTLDGTNGFRIPAIDAWDVPDLPVTWISSAGDVNADGLYDIMIGASGGDGTENLTAESGECYIVFGRSTAFPATLDLKTLNGSNGFRINGVSANDATGFAVSSAGDTNGDGYDDVIISNDSTYSPGAGSCFVFFGSSTGLPASFDLSKLDGTNGFQFSGIDPLDFLGFSVSSAGDVNNDSFADIVVGAPWSAPGGDAFGGEAYVVFGKPSGFGAMFDLSTLNGANGFRIDGINAGDAAGLSVSNAGDVNGDGIDDIVIGASGGDTGGILDAGEAYVIFGSMSAFAATLDLGSLNGTNGFRLDGIAPGDAAGVTVSAAGDVDGDGFDDIIVGANHADPGGRIDAGQTYVVFGGNFTGGIETQVGTSVANALTANRGVAAVDILVGKQGNDILISDGGPDVLLGGEGNDITSIVSTSFRRIVGGPGTDTLKLAGSGITLDLSTIADSRLTGIEQIDITGSGNNTLTLNQREVLNLSDESNTLIVLGNLGDVVNFGSGWTQGTNETIGADTFHVYTQGTVTLKLQATIIQNLAPVLGEIGSKSVSEGSLLTFTASASDVDGLTFSLDAGAPSGASIDANSGVFTWTPSEAQGPATFYITVRVTDNGTPNLDDFETIEVIVIDDHPWQNYLDPADVNTDGFVRPTDALIIINHLNSSGARLLPAIKPPGLWYIDVNGNGLVSPTDALIVINRLNDRNGSAEGESSTVNTESEYSLHYFVNRYGLDNILSPEKHNTAAKPQTASFTCSQAVPKFAGREETDYRGFENQVRFSDVRVQESEMQSALELIGVDVASARSKRRVPWESTCGTGKVTTIAERLTSKKAFSCS